MMQAFIYHHLVPMKSLSVVVAERRQPTATLKLLGEVPVKLPADGTAPVRFALPRAPMRGKLHFALRDPPEGISIQKASPTNDDVTLLLHADAEKATPGMKGNLIVDVTVEGVAKPGGGKQANKQRPPLGTTPPIPFEVVDNE
jgi:hypothetical protein